ncbi:MULTISPECIES: Mur ligase family protein [Limnochorda]|uniref:Mur ligase family protein n=1 Tax=Limnochorda TaxID=1676651 RepID=UPI0017B1CBF5|nr:Mur ligase family protein [Limnochorda pilosa]MBO2485452.1 hypothetical protein [Bacillota bacterium]MBO2518750.1 hypothetical protein [Bacillota bacterium]NMA70782.1 hypothetical protein [Bacillota bacterium]
MKHWVELLDGLPWHVPPDRFRPPEPDLVVSSVTHDSRQVQPGALFVAIRGHRTDGNRHAAEAVAAGAVLVVTDAPERLPALEAPVVQVPDARVALAQIAARFYDHPAQRLTVIGITGTLGKTSVAEMVAAILQAAGPAYEPGIIGSLGIRFRGETRASLLTTPDALTLHRSLAEMAEAGVRVVVMEVTSHAQLQSRVAGLPFSVACVLNLVPGEHAEIHPTFDHYAAVKLRLLDQLRPGGLLVFNGDDPHLVGRAGERLGQMPVLAVGKGGRPRRRLPPVPTLLYDGAGPGPLTLTTTGPYPSLEGERPPARFSVPLALWGEQNRQNAAAAAAIALALGMSPETVVQGLARVRPARRRMEPVYEGGFRVLDDTTGHPASFEALFRSLAAVPREGVVLLTAVRGSRGEAINRANARAIARWVRDLPIRHVVVTASTEAVHPKDAVQPGEWQAFREELAHAGVLAEYHLELEPAVEAALATVRPGEILVLAGAQGLDQATPILRRLLRQRAARSQ